jgi:hypothetical protein
MKSLYISQGRLTWYRLGHKAQVSVRITSLLQLEEKANFISDMLAALH